MSFIRRAPTESDILASHKSSMTKLTRSGKATPQTPSLFEPPRNDNHKKAQYFAKCDEICGMDVKTMEDYFTIGFACWAGTQVITGQEFDGLANKNEIWKAATDLA
ncbi:hypothetical protein M378DRAFT_158839 [Amanita muscaria Koide BX008]|uniref:Uncharacterized protein n=1 Tax=Amanita muscaria (strain Koide BX008) TaxID=946122 RepID=A0A0C2SXQ3_AMAMK|nr:hypothetical protein M378DRAFT_158839 [Amanita muscaria Koide BX008]